MEVRARRGKIRRAGCGPMCEAVSVLLLCAYNGGRGTASPLTWKKLTEGQHQRWKPGRGRGSRRWWGAEVPTPSSPLVRLLLFREELGIVPSDNMIAPKERLKDTNMEFPKEKGQAY